MADAGTAGPADRHIAGFGQFEQAAVAGAPADGQAAARERDLGARAGRRGGRVRRPGGGGRYAGRAGGGGAEDLGVHAGAVKPQVCHGGGHPGHEPGRAADVCVGVGREAEAGQHGGRQAARRLVVAARNLAGVRTAVADMPVPVGQRRQQGTRLVGERFLGPVAGAVQPPDLAAGPPGGECVQHGQDGGRPDARADQQDGPVPGPEDERPPGRGRLQLVTGPDPVVYELAADTVRLALDADAVGARGGRPGQRIAAQQRPGAGGGVQPQGQELPGLGRRQGSPGGIGQGHRCHRVAFPAHRGHRQRTEARPGRRRAGLRPGRRCP